MRCVLNYSLSVLIAFFGFSMTSSAQTTKPPAKAVSDAKETSLLDLSGVWNGAPNARPRDADQHGPKETLTPDVDYADLFTFRHYPYPMQPWAAEKFNYNKDPTNPYYRGRSETDPFVTMCSPHGPTALWQISSPFEIIQSPKRVLIVFEYNHEIRQIWTDGREHPKEFGHNWMGHSIGRWEGDVLVVDTIGLNNIPWLDEAGHVHSDALHLVERLQRVRHDLLSLSITFDDPKTFTMPWAAKRNFVLKPNWEIEEAPECEDDFVGKSVPLQP